MIVDGGTISFADHALSVGADPGTGLRITGGGVVDGGAQFALTGNMLVDPSGTFRAPGGGQGGYSVSGTLTNGGVVTLQDGTAGDVLTVGGNYVGQGGQLRLDTLIGSTGTKSDMLIVKGNVSGTTILAVQALGDGKATPTADGIKLVQVDGISSVGAFALAGGTVQAGAYRYDLRLGGVTDPGDQDWYLRSRARDIVGRRSISPD